MKIDSYIKEQFGIKGAPAPWDTEKMVNNEIEY